jgi:23S rRNA A2030 N6-methylase RlmJ
MAFDVADHEVHLDQQELQDIPDPFVTDVEFKADMDKYTSWGKQKLIREILRRVPSLRAMELDPKPLETLAKILVAFS